MVASLHHETYQKVEQEYIYHNEHPDHQMLATESEKSKRQLLTFNTTFLEPSGVLTNKATQNSIGFPESPSL